MFAGRHRTPGGPLNRANCVNKTQFRKQKTIASQCTVLHFGGKGRYRCASKEIPHIIVLRRTKPRPGTLCSSRQACPHGEVAVRKLRTGVGWITTTTQIPKNRKANAPIKSILGETNRARCVKASAAFVFVAGDPR